MDGSGVMTRINVVPVGELASKHLVAEYRELPRVFGLVRHYRTKRAHRDEQDILDEIRYAQPQEYVLGTGHVLFFYDKLLWLSWRQIALVNEMASRGYDPKFRENLRVTHSNIPGDWWGDYEPTEAALTLNRARISQRTLEASQRATSRQR
jgi:deoxyribonuclease (pyrimidine dimer)